MPMRAVWIALLIALLPLRGWVGDAMALSMLQGMDGQPAQLSSAEPCPHAGQASPAMQAEAQDGAAHLGMHGEGAPEAGSGHDHLVCDLCNGPALQAGMAGAPREELAPGPHVVRAERFASLAPRHHHKPPIA